MATQKLNFATKVDYKIGFQPYLELVGGCSQAMKTHRTKTTKAAELSHAKGAILLGECDLLTEDASLSNEPGNGLEAVQRSGTQTV